VGEEFKWRKSTFSGSASSNCVEVALLVSGTVAVRDSKHPAGPVLMFSRGEWSAFIAGVLAREFDLGEV